MEVFTTKGTINFNSKVTSVSPNKLGGYSVSWDQKENIITKDVDYVIVATGIFTESYIPNIEGLSNFSGKVIHTKDYKDGSTLSGKKVLVVGGSLSAVEVAGDISNYTHVTHSFKDPFWIIKRYIPKNPDLETIKYPLDLVFYNRKFYEAPKISSIEEGYNKKNTYMNMLCKDQEGYDELKVDKSEYKLPIKIAISDKYLDNIKLGMIKPLKVKIVKFLENKVIFSNGEENIFDTVIMATGYRVNLEYLDPTILKQISYNPEDQIQPTILYNTTFHPKVPNMSFIGIYKGPYFAVMEQQAKLAINMATGHLPLLSEEEINEELILEQKIRDLTPKPQFPHADYVNFADTITRLTNNNLDFTKLKKDNPDLYIKYIENPVLPGNFTLDNIEKQIETNMEIIDSCALTGEYKELDYLN